jgi:hypothetical protein
MNAVSNVVPIGRLMNGAEMLMGGTPKGFFGRN